MNIKELKVRTVPLKGSVYEVYYDGGGQVPEVLKGMYTSIRNALMAISYYTPPKKSKKEDKDGQKNR